MLSAKHTFLLIILYESQNKLLNHLYVSVINYHIALYTKLWY